MGLAEAKSFARCVPIPVQFAVKCGGLVFCIQIDGVTLGRECLPFILAAGQVETQVVVFHLNSGCDALAAPNLYFRLLIVGEGKLNKSEYAHKSSEQKAHFEREYEFTHVQPPH